MAMGTAEISKGRTEAAEDLLDEAEFLSVPISKDEKSRVREVAFKRVVSMAEVGRIAIRYWLDKNYPVKKTGKRGE